MATKTKKKDPETQENNIASKITAAYIDYILTKGRKPTSVYEFISKLKIEEQEFYNHFNSFEVLEKNIWSGFVQTTLDTLSVSEEYNSYPVKEKLLTFYYTLVEVLKKNRSYILVSSEHGAEMLRNNILSKIREVYKEYVTQLMADGTESGEVVKRPYIADKYPEGFWLQLLFVIRFWIKDDSQGFEKTDAAIEKAVKLSFDLIGPGAVDSLFDMAKFLYQNK